VLCGVLAIASLSFLPELFSVFAWLGVGAWVGGVVPWVIVMWKTLSGDEWRIPIAAGWAERLATPVSAAASS